MIFRTGILVTALASASVSLAQESNPMTSNYIRNSYILQRMSSPTSLQTGSIPGMAQPPPETVGDVYLYAEYRKTTFLLFEGDRLVEGYKSKYDIQRNEFDLLTQQGVKVLPGKMVRSMVWLDTLSGSPQYFFNYQDYKNEDGVPYVGFFQLVSDGEIPLLKKTELLLAKADYSPVLGSGHRENRYIKKPHLYAIRNSVIVPLTSKNDILKLLADEQEEMNAFIKKNSLNLKQESHVTALFEHYNRLKKGIQEQSR